MIIPHCPLRRGTLTKKLILLKKYGFKVDTLLSLPRDSSFQNSYKEPTLNKKATPFGIAFSE